MEGMRRIVVLRANAIGDYVFTLPALEGLRRTFPGTEIALVGAPWMAPFLAGRPSPVARGDGREPMAPGRKMAREGPREAVRGEGQIPARRAAGRAGYVASSTTSTLRPPARR
jgi:hypothetical protein